MPIGRRCPLWTSLVRLIALSCLLGFARASSLPIRFADGLLWIDIQADPTPDSPTLRFLVDTGASISVLDRHAADRLGLPLGPAVPVAGVKTIVQGHGPIPWRARAGSELLPAEVLVLDLSALRLACGRPVDGLLGADFFRRRIVEIDYRAERLRILPSSPGNPGDNAVPLRVGPRGLSVEARINGGLPEALRVDTGCASALQWVSATCRGRRAPRTEATGLARISVPQTMTGIRLGSRTLDTVPTGVHRRPIFDQEAGLLGNGVLAMFGVVTFDSPAGHLHLGPSPPPHPRAPSGAPAGS